MDEKDSKVLRRPFARNPHLSLKCHFRLFNSNRAIVAAAADGLGIAFGMIGSG